MTNFDFDRNHQFRTNLVASILSLEELARSYNASGKHDLYNQIINRIAETRLELHYYEAEYHEAIERRVADDYVVPKKPFWKHLLRK